MIMLTVVLATATLLLAAVHRDSFAMARAAATQDVLATAREALIEYALTAPYRNTADAHLLPCPDIDDSGPFADGEAHTSACGAPGETVLGRVPWRTLGIAPPKDRSGACLWYVVSGSWKQAAAATPTLANADTNGQLQLYGIESGAVIAGQTASERPLAMIIAAADPVAGQVRAAADPRLCRRGRRRRLSRHGYRLRNIQRRIERQRRFARCSGRRGNGQRPAQ